MMNQDNPYAMNQTCKVCGEPAAGFHFGAFTCEGCKSFFGRSYNNLSSISDCKNNGECIINKKNRTACKACRLKKCLMVGMSKSGSRYGRRSNWFKIHCLLQEQQQQAAAAMAAHHNNQQAGNNGANGVKSMSGVPPSSAAAAALGMLGHAAGAYPGLYAAAAGPRSKEELMMLGLDNSYENAMKHPGVASPSVSSPDSHNSDSSVEVSVRGNPLLHLQHPPSSGDGTQTVASTAPGRPPQMRKDLPPFLPLSFPGLSSMPVMPPPAFLPPSHLLFPGYHPALYSHHQGLLKPTPEQQQAAVAAAAVQHLFNSSSASAAAAQRFAPQLPPGPSVSPFASTHKERHSRQELEEHASHSPKSEPVYNNNNHIISNGSKTAAEELTKRFYLDAVLKSQQHSPPPLATKLPLHSKQDYSISALVTPNSESGRERMQSRQSNGEADEDVECDVRRSASAEASACADNEDEEEEEEEDLVVSMTPPRSPAQLSQAVAEHSAQDNPIDLSMKTTGSSASSKSSAHEPAATDGHGDSDSESVAAHEEAAELEVVAELEQDKNMEKEKEEQEQDSSTIEETSKTSFEQCSKLNNNNNNNSSTSDYGAHEPGLEAVKRKLDELVKDATEGNGKRLKLEPSVAAVKVATSTALDLTTKV